MTPSIWTLFGQAFTLIFFVLFILLVVWVPLTLYRMNKHLAEISRQLRSMNGSQAGDQGQVTRDSH
jgi:Na+/melibiose symporter-like transporter